MGKEEPVTFLENPNLFDDVPSLVQNKYGHESWYRRVIEVFIYKKINQSERHTPFMSVTSSLLVIKDTGHFYSAFGKLKLFL